MIFLKGIFMKKIGLFLSLFVLLFVLLSISVFAQNEYVLMQTHLTIWSTVKLPQ